MEALQSASRLRGVRDEHEDSKHENEQWNNEDFKHGTMVRKDINLRTVSKFGYIFRVCAGQHGHKGVGQRLVAPPTLNILL